MRRVTSHCRVEPFAAALDLLPGRLRDLAERCHVFTEDPVHAGLHGFEEASYERSYRSTAHVTYEYHQGGLLRAHRATTVVLPEILSVEHAVHELGHVIHHNLGNEHTAEAVSWYGATNHYEAFAEALVAWTIPGYAKTPGAATRALFEALAAGYCP